MRTGQEQASLRIMMDALMLCADYFDNKADADHDGEGFVYNEEMRLLERVLEAQVMIAKAISSSQVGERVSQ